MLGQCHTWTKGLGYIYGQHQWLQQLHAKKVITYYCSFSSEDLGRFGIVHFNNDLVFTLLNVVSHGIPYIALIYLKEIDQKPKEELGVLTHFKNYKGLLIYIGIMLFIAFSEEYLWEMFVWKEQFRQLLLMFRLGSLFWFHC